MALHEERMQILNMIQNGQISAEEGAKLLSALGISAKESTVTEGAQPRWFRLRVTDLKTGRRKVNLSIPMSLVNVGIKMGARFVPEGQGVDHEALANALRSGAQGKVVDIEDEESDERVEIFVE